MDDATFTSDAASMKRRILLGQLLTIRSSLMGNKGAADDDDSRDVIKDLAKKGMTLNKEQLTALSTEFLLTVLLDVMLLRLLDEGPAGSSDQQQVVDDAAAAKKKKRSAVKKKRNKRNKAAAKQQHKKTKLMSSWMGGGIISVIMVVAFSFSFITTPIVTLSLFQPSNGSVEGNAPPALPPSASKILRQEDLKPNDEASTSPDIISSPLAAVVPPPVFLPTALSNRRMKSDEMRALTCLNTPDWKDANGYGCDWYEQCEWEEPGCPDTDKWAGDIGPATKHCCFCGGGSHSLPPTNSPKPSNSPTISAAPSSSSKPSSSPTKSANPSTTPCFDTPNWKDKIGYGCYSYEGYEEEEDECSNANFYAGDMGSATTHCCICDDGGSTTCEDFRSKCQEYINVLDLGFNKSGLVAPLCKEAESCSCEAADHDVEIVAGTGGNYTDGLYNECKCDFWLRVCEDTGAGEACDYAAEYCCGDYSYEEDYWGFEYQNSPTCYCDFFNYAQEEFGHTLKPKALNINKEFENPCVKLFRSTIESVLFYRLEFERPSLEAIYNRTNGQNWTNSAGWMNVSVDHCQWYGISCDSDGFVTSIDLRDNNLAGHFPVYTLNTYPSGEPTREGHWIYTKYGLANLYHLKTLDLSDNKLTGTIDYRPLYNLHLLTQFDISGNQLSGRMDAFVTPSLTYVDFSNNKFTSLLSFKKFKQSYQKLRYCDVSNNEIKNDASDLLENIPPNIEQFLASNNQIYGILPESLNSLSKLSQFDMSSNALSGSLPGFADLILSLQQLNLSNQTNGFTGSIPKDLWRFQSLKVLNLASNKIAGHIPPDIGKMTALEEFDLSNNSLVNAIPSELGQLAGSLKHLRLSNNMFTGSIPSEIGQLQGATVFLKLKENNFYDSSKTAPLSLCTLRSVKEFDLASDTQLCPIERNALNDFYYSTKGAEWTNDTNWLDEYESYCNWHGVTCDEGKNVNKLELDNNGLSGRFSKSIGDVTSIKVLDLSDNDIKGSIPTEVGQLSELTYLRLSYNAFTGTAECLGKLTKLQLLQLQSNRITGMPNMTQLDKNKSEYNESTFVTDCGVPSAFDETPECENCTMCCNANEDCYPQEVTPFEKMGLTYITFPAVFFVSFIVICCMVALSLYLFGRRKNRGNDLTMSAERRLEEDDKYALSRIGKESVYSYFVTDMVFGWLVAFATLGIQVGILVFFIKASEANLQEDTIDIQFTWKCPRDSDMCKNTADLSDAGWFIFSMLMVAFLAKDMINGSKLLYHSSESSHNLGPRIRYFIGGICLCSITLFALYVSTVYNKAIATSNTDIIVNSVVVLFIMEIDEYIFAALKASNKKWTAHAEESEDSSLVTEVSEMKEEFEVQRAQIASQQEQITDQQGQITAQQGQITAQQEELKKLRVMVEKMLWETAW